MTTATVDPESYGVDYWTRQYGAWYGLLASPFVRNARNVKELMQSLGGVDRKVLDVGCATGLQVAAFRAIGIDLDAYGIDLSHAAMQNADPAAWPYVYEGSATNLPFRDNEFGFVFCSDVFEHLTDDQARMAFREIARVSGGKAWIQINTGRESRWKFHADPTHINKKSIEKWRDMAKEAGLMASLVMEPDGVIPFTNSGPYEPWCGPPELLVILACLAGRQALVKRIASHPGLTANRKAGDPALWSKKPLLDAIDAVLLDLTDERILRPHLQPDFIDLLQQPWVLDAHESMRRVAMDPEQGPNLMSAAREYADALFFARPKLVSLRDSIRATDRDLSPLTLQHMAEDTVHTMRSEASLANLWLDTARARARPLGHPDHVDPSGYLSLTGPNVLEHVRRAAAVAAESGLQDTLIPSRLLDDGSLTKVAELAPLTFAI